MFLLELDKGAELGEVAHLPGDLQRRGLLLGVEGSCHGLVRTCLSHERKKYAAARSIGRRGPSRSTRVGRRSGIIFLDGCFTPFAHDISLNVGISPFERPRLEALTKARNQVF